MMLDAYLARARRKLFVWGESDCCLFVADWALAVSGRDPAEQWRGYVSDERDAASVLRSGGGLLRVVTLAFSRSGFARTRHPIDGDVAVLRVQGALACGILRQGLWHARTLDSVASLGATGAGVVRAWEVNPCRP